MKWGRRLQLSESQQVLCQKRSSVSCPRRLTYSVRVPTLNYEAAPARHLHVGHHNSRLASCKSAAVGSITCPAVDV